MPEFVALLPAVITKTFALVNELTENVPSRSAKLRFVVKKKNFYNFDSDIFEKFKFFIEIENISNKL